MEIGSSSVARGIISLVIGYITSIVVDLAILIEVCITTLITSFRIFRDSISSRSCIYIDLKLILFEYSLSVGLQLI